MTIATSHGKEGNVSERQNFYVKTELQEMSQAKICEKAQNQESPFVGFMRGWWMSVRFGT